MFWQQLPAPTAKSAGMTVKGNALVKCDSYHPLPCSWCQYADFSSVVREAAARQICLLTLQTARRPMHCIIFTDQHLCHWKTSKNINFKHQVGKRGAVVWCVGVGCLSVLSRNIRILRPVSLVRLTFPMLSFDTVSLLMHSALAFNCSSLSSEKVHNPVREHFKSFHSEIIFVFKMHTSASLQDPASWTRDACGVLRSSTLNVNQRCLSWDAHFNRHS